MKNIVIVMTIALSMVLTGCLDKDKANADQIEQVVILNVAPEFRQKFKELLSENALKTENEPGNIYLKVYQDRKEVNQFVVISRWKNKKAMQLHGEFDYSKSLYELSKTALASPPKVFILNKIDNALIGKERD